MARTLRFIPLLFALVWFSGCGESGTDPAVPTNRIAIYNGNGANTEFAEAVKAAMEADGRVADLVDEAQIQNSLNDYGLVIIASGDPIDMANALGYTGRQRIQGLVAAGGGFIGLGTGAYLGADSMSYEGSGALSTPLEFYEGLAKGPIASIASTGYTLTPVTITDTEFDPGAATTFETMYFEGPEFLVDESLSARIIANYSVNSLIAAVGFNYGPGRVALCSFCPEIEENDPRDGTSFGDDLVDPDSEWFFLQTLVAYCLHEVLIGE